MGCALCHVGDMGYDMEMNSAQKFLDAELQIVQLGSMQSCLDLHPKVEPIQPPLGVLHSRMLSISRYP